MEFICIYNRSIHYWKILASDLIIELHLEIGLKSTLQLQWSTEINPSDLLRSVILSASFIWALAHFLLIACWTTLRPTKIPYNTPSFTPNWFPRFDSTSLHTTLPIPLHLHALILHHLFLPMTDLMTRRNPHLSCSWGRTAKNSQSKETKMKYSGITW